MKEAAKINAEPEVEDDDGEEEDEDNNGEGNWKRESLLVMYAELSKF